MSEELRKVPSGGGLSGSEVDSLTGLPMVTETRKRERWRALPRTISKQAQAQDDADGKPWYPADHHRYDGHILAHVGCWKCNRPLKAWRMMLDGEGNRVTLPSKDGLGEATAFTLLPLPHLRTTPFLYRLPLIKQTVAMNALHCADCEIRTEDALDVLACQWAGVDGILQTAWNNNMAQHLHPSRWATYLYRWSQVDLVGKVRPEDIMDAHQKIPAAGELITAAGYILDQDAARRALMPKGVIVEFGGETVPMGWRAHATRTGFIEKL